MIFCPLTKDFNSKFLLFDAETYTNIYYPLSFGNGQLTSLRLCKDDEDLFIESAHNKALLWNPIKASFEFDEVKFFKANEKEFFLNDKIKIKVYGLFDDFDIEPIHFIYPSNPFNIQSSYRFPKIYAYKIYEADWKRPRLIINPQFIVSFIDKSGEKA